MPSGRYEGIELKTQELRDVTTGPWFRENQASPDGKAEMTREQEFIAGCGLQLGPVERHVRLSPGALLIVDNVHAVHGRIGVRQSREDLLIVASPMA